ncbi:Protein disulfide isomerase-like 1-4 [Ancistrocladus abbreviatus]
MATRTALYVALSLSLSLFLLSAALTSPATATTTKTTSTNSQSQSTPSDDLDEDLSFLEEGEPSGSDSPSENNYYDHASDDGDFENYEDFQNWESEHYPTPSVDEKDVVVLNGSNFDDFLSKNKYLMVEFYAPWCGHCQALAPEYAAAATALKAEGGEVALAKVDATEENELANKYNVEGFPTVFFFIDGEHQQYNGQRTKDTIVAWVKKKTGPGVHNVTTMEEAERIMSSESKFVVAFLDSLTGAESVELGAASRLEDDVNFYQTASPDVAKVLHIDPKANRPSLVLVKEHDEKLSHYDGKFSKSAIKEFVSANKMPIVVNFTRESAPLVFENPIKKQVLLFATSNDTEKLISSFREAAKAFKGKLIFVYVEMDNQDYGKPVSDHFGIMGLAPRVLAYTGNEDGKKYLLDGDLTLSKIKSFAEDFLGDKLQPFFKSDPVPEKNDGDVKIIVGKNFDEIVLDELKDVLLEIYAPWCLHCHALEPIYNKLAKSLKGIDSIVIAKMDGTTNEHPRAKADGFPTILFFPAGNKSFDPITVDADRTVVALYKFLKKHASIPFKIKKPASPPKSESPDATITVEAPDAAKTLGSPSSSDSLKDEL